LDEDDWFIVFFFPNGDDWFIVEEKVKRKEGSCVFGHTKEKRYNRVSLLCQNPKIPM
jgi:hypothetical protein